jgi:NTP pyrophosphatase (non-canonical NTP hydrolase)
MTFEELETFISNQDEILGSKKPEYSERERAFAYTVKLGEEYGELCDAVLAHMGDQRKDKLAAKDESELRGEFADVTIVTFLLARRLGVDMSSALKEKIGTIQKKHNAQL